MDRASTAHRHRIQETADPYPNDPAWTDVFDAGPISVVSYYPKGNNRMYGKPAYHVLFRNMNSDQMLPVEDATPWFIETYGHVEKAVEGVGLPTHRASTHPGIVLLEDFIKPKNDSVESAAKHMGLEASYLQSIVDGQTSVLSGASVLERIVHYTGTTNYFWANLQHAYDATNHLPA